MAPRRLFRVSAYSRVVSFTTFFDSSRLTICREWKYWLQATTTSWPTSPSPMSRMFIVSWCPRCDPCSVTGNNPPWAGRPVACIGRRRGLEAAVSRFGPKGGSHSHWMARPGRVPSAVTRLRDGEGNRVRQGGRTRLALGAKRPQTPGRQQNPIRPRNRHHLVRRRRGRVRPQVDGSGSAQAKLSSSTRGLDSSTNPASPPGP